MCIPHTCKIYNTVVLFILPILCIIGSIGNVLVCISISVDRRLQNVTNYFLFSLAIADLLVCMLVMPLSLIVELKNGLWVWNFSWCLLYCYSDVFFCSASIVHMTSISLDRYLGISNPLKQRNKSRSVVGLKITIVWVLTCIISSPLAVLALYDGTNILNDNVCAINNRFFMLYGSVLSFAIPLAIMAFTYVLTTRLLTQQAALLSNRRNDERFRSGLRRTMVPRRKTKRRNSGNLSFGSSSPKSISKTGNTNAPNGSCSPSPPTIDKSFPSRGLSPLVAHSISRSTKCDSPHKELISKSKSDSYHLEMSTISPVSTTTTGELVGGLCVALFPLSKTSRLRNRITGLCNRTHILSKFAGGGRDSTDSDQLKEKKRKAKAELANERKATRVNIITNGESQRNKNQKLRFQAGQFHYFYVIYTIFNRHFRQAFINVIQCNFGQHCKSSGHGVIMDHMAAQRGIHGFGCRCIQIKSAPGTATISARFGLQENPNFMMAPCRSTVPPFRRNSPMATPMRPLVESNSSTSPKSSFGHPLNSMGKMFLSPSVSIPRRASCDNVPRPTDHINAGLTNKQFELPTRTFDQFQLLETNTPQHRINSAFQNNGRTSIYGENESYYDDSYSIKSDSYNLHGGRRWSRRRSPEWVQNKVHQDRILHTAFHSIFHPLRSIRPTLSSRTSLSIEGQNLATSALLSGVFSTLLFPNIIGAQRRPTLLTPIERKYSRPRRKFTLPDSYSSSQRYEIDSLLGRGIETDELKEVDQRKPSSSAIIQTILVPMAIAKQLSVAGGENRSATVPVYEARRVSCIPLLRIEGSKDEEIKTEKCAENNLVVCTNKL